MKGGWSVIDDPLTTLHQNPSFLFLLQFSMERKKKLKRGKKQKEKRKK